MKPIVLASASEARASLLAGAGIAFETIPAGIDEEAFGRGWLCEGREPARLASVLARQKALAVAALRPGQLVLGCDQVLLLGGDVVTKCRNESEAEVLLRRLRGRTHELTTAAAFAVGRELIWEHTEFCRLAMRDFSDSFLDEYISSAGDALTACVGCYRLEGFGAQLFDSVKGDYFSVLGLPLLDVLAELRRLGVAQS